MTTKEIIKLGVGVFTVDISGSEYTMENFISTENELMCRISKKYKREVLVGYGCVEEKYFIDLESLSPCITAYNILLNRIFSCTIANKNITLINKQNNDN